MAIQDFPYDLNDLLISNIFTKIGIKDKDDAFKSMEFLNSEYFVSVLEIVSRLHMLHREMISILDEMDGRKYLIGKIVIMEHTILSIKFYIVNWFSLSDMIAELLNSVFDIGIAKKDLHFSLIVDNKHVRNAGIWDIISSYKEVLSIGKLKGIRNDIVHHGYLKDDAANALVKKQTKIISRKHTILFRDEDYTDEEYKMDMDSLNIEIKELSKNKKDHYEKHYWSTLEMLGKIGDVITDKMKEYYLEKY